MTMLATQQSDPERRTWAYLQPPKAFDIAPCACGNHDTQWSEFKGHIWCDKCQLDFKPAHGGVFDGPIPTQLAHMLGLRFDRVQLATGRVERRDPEAGEYVVEAPAGQGGATRASSLASAG